MTIKRTYELIEKHAMFVHDFITNRQYIYAAYHIGKISGLLDSIPPHTDKALKRWKEWCEYCGRQIDICMRGAKNE